MGIALEFRHAETGVTITWERSQSGTPLLATVEVSYPDEFEVTNRLWRVDLTKSSLKYPEGSSEGSSSKKIDLEGLKRLAKQTTDKLAADDRFQDKLAIEQFLSGALKQEAVCVISDVSYVLSFSYTNSEAMLSISLEDRVLASVVVSFDEFTYEHPRAECDGRWSCFPYGRSRP